MAGFPEPLLGRIDSYHSDGSYKIVYNPTGAIERVGWEELYVILKHMEEEVQIKCIAEEDRKENIDAALEALEVKKMQEKMAIAEESLKRRDSSNMDQAREFFTHVGRPIVLANNELAVVVDKKDGQIIVRGKDQKERSISVDEFNAALDKVTGISSPLLFVGPSTDAPKNRDAKSNDKLTADEAIGERTGQLCFARAQKQTLCGLQNCWL